MNKQESVNGGLILGLGIAGLVLLVIFSCVGLICGPVAWSMGDTALKKLSAAGIEDGTERSLASAGRICGIFTAIIYLGLLLVMLATQK